ncbi:MAG: transcriptional regulator [Clostridiales bacterium]|nr:transcriptional regulator [Clostridiales bacterium]
MRELTFIGFLKQYVRALSFSNTGSLSKLASEAASDNPRLREPLFLFALFSGKEKVLLTATKLPELHREYANMLKQYDRQGMEQSLQSGDPILPEEYAKVYRSYLNLKNKNKNDMHTKSLMRNRIIQLQREKKITNYRLYTDLQINHGNMNAYIKHGDCSKVSIEIARRVVEYIECL